MGIVFNDEYEKMDEKYEGQMYKLWGPQLLGFPIDVDSSRLYMLTSNIKQILTLVDPDVARIQTGYEKTIGKYNKSYKYLEGKWKVVDKIRKFNSDDIYTLVLYNKKTDTYDMIEKRIAENLTEKFGYTYNNERMDQLQVGETIKNEIISKTTSYDEHMNYRLGKNALVMYTTSNDTIEDAITIRKGWADTVKSVEIDTIEVPINDNDVLLNLYGNDETYKSFPDIGESVNNSILCATRRIVKDHLLYDFQENNMREIYSTDADYYASKNSIVYDIDVFYNNDNEFPKNIFYKQLKYYYECGCNYADQLTEWAKKIKKSGSKYTDNVSYIKSKYQHFTDPEYKWKNKDRVFSNIIVKFKVKSLTSLEAGFKLVGRYGDKGIIANIVDDTSIQNQVLNCMDSIIDMVDRDMNEEDRAKLASSIKFADDSRMPYTEDGRKVDILLNSSGSIRRLNTGQLYEVDINFASEEIRKKLCTLKTMEEKEDLIFKYLSILNKDQYDFFYNMYKSFDVTIDANGRKVRFLDEYSKKAFIEDVEKNGFYLIKPPDSNIRYDTLKEVYDTFDFIKPLPLYIDLFGIKGKRIMRDAVIGEKYMFLLKQTSNKNFSARSTGRVNKKNLPEKSSDKKNNRSSFSTSPIRIGEAYNLFSSISGRTLAEFNIFMRSSPIGRKSLKRILEAEGNPLQINKLKIKDNFTNSNADILNAYLKGMGIGLAFVTDNSDKDEIISDVIMPMKINGIMVYDSPLNKPIYVKLFKLYKNWIETNTVIESEPGQKNKIAWDYVFELPEVKDMNVPDSIQDMVRNSTL